jgi:hypothetical protein
VSVVGRVLAAAPSRETVRPVPLLGRRHRYSDVVLRDSLLERRLFDAQREVHGAVVMLGLNQPPLTCQGLDPDANNPQSAEADLGVFLRASGWAILGSNQWPLPCQGSALPLS